MIHGLTALWPPASLLPTHFDMLALLAFLLSGFLLLKFMNDDYLKQLEDKKKKKQEEEEVVEKKHREEQGVVEKNDKEKNDCSGPDTELERQESEELDSPIQEKQPEEEILEKAEELPADPVFIAPPPPHDEMDHPLPMICVLEKTTPAEEFGFNLHAEKNRGHFIGTVDAGGIGDRAGLRLGQRIVGVNGTLVYPNTPHKEVVALIKKSPLSTTLLLASEDVDQWHKTHNEPFSFDKAINAKAPEQQLSPHSIQISDEEEIVEAHPSPAPRHEESKVEEAPPLPTQPVRYEEPPMVQYDLVPGDQEDIMASVFGSVPVETIVVGNTVTVEEDREQEHLVDHHGHNGQPLVAEEPAEEEHLPYTAYAPAETVHHPHHENHHHHHHEEYHHEENYEDHNHNGHHDPYQNGKINGYSRQTSEPSDVDIFRLSAKEARERLRQQKKRALDMSLEEKYRVVSSM